MSKCPNYGMGTGGSEPSLSVQTFCVHTWGVSGVLDNVQNLVGFFLMAPLSNFLFHLVFSIISKLIHEDWSKFAWSFENSDQDLINAMDHARILTASLEARFCGTNHLFEGKRKKIIQKKNLRKEDLEKISLKNYSAVRKAQFLFSWKYLQIMWRSANICWFCLLE